MKACITPSIIYLFTFYVFFPPSNCKVIDGISNNNTTTIDNKHNNSTNRVHAIIQWKIYIFSYALTFSMRNFWCNVLIMREKEGSPSYYPSFFFPWKESHFFTTTLSFRMHNSLSTIKVLLQGFKWIDLFG